MPTNADKHSREGDDIFVNADVVDRQLLKRQREEISHKDNDATGEGATRIFDNREVDEGHNEYIQEHAEELKMIQNQKQSIDHGMNGFKMEMMTMMTMSTMKKTQPMMKW